MHLLSHISLRNRPFTALVGVVVTILGILAMLTMRQELIPSVELPQVQVIATEPGATSKQMRERGAQPIEQSVQALENVEGTSSTSQSSLTRITIDLEYGTDVARSANQVEANLNRIKDQLPEGMDTQVVAGGSGDIPAGILAVSSELDPAKLNARLSSQVIPELERIDGVASVVVVGGPERIVRITPDQPKLDEHGLTTGDIQKAIDDNGLSIPGGQVADGSRTLDVTVGESIDSVDKLKEIPVTPSAGGGAAGPDGQQGQPGQDGQMGQDGQQGQAGQDPQAPAEPVALSEIGKVEETTKTAENISRTNGRDSLVMMVMPTSDANLVQVSTDVNATMDRLRGDIGGDAEISTVFDQAPFIQQSIASLAEEGLLGLVFAIAVILLFLLAIRPTIVTAISIPLSLLMAFVGMMVSGYTLNMLTMAALTISIGRVVDDSIVVIENITRHLDEGPEKPTPAQRMRAIGVAVREVGGAITASTLATVLVFLPVAVVSGMAGELFRPFALTVAIAMLASLFVSLTIVPVLAYWFLRPSRRGRKKAERAAQSAQAAETPEGAPADGTRRDPLLSRIYRAVLVWTQRHTIITVVLALAVLVGTGFLMPLMKINLLSDSGQNMASYSQTLPNGTSLEATGKKASEVEKKVMAVDGVETVQTTIGASDFGMGGAANEVSYSITTDVDADQEALRKDILKAMQSVPDAGEIEETAMGGPTGSNDVTIEISAATAKERQRANDILMKELTKGKMPAGIDRVTSDLEADQPTAVVAVDRKKAAEAGMSDSAIVGMVAQQLVPQGIGTLSTADADLEIQLADQKKAETLEDLKKIEIAGKPITDFAEIREENIPPTISSKDNQDTVTISVTPSGDDTRDAVARAQAAIDATKDDLPETARAQIGGASAEIDDTFTQLGIAILAAILLVYVLLVWIFKSLIQPLILLISIPFAAVGAFGLLILTQVPLGLPSMIGLLMLVGIVVTNAIVLIDLVNQRRRDGMGLEEAILDGAQKRLRPILMTAAATIFALVPMAFGITGEGGFISQPLAVVVIGGLVSSTVLTLVIVPVLYRITEGFGERRRLREADGDATASGVDESAPADGAAHGKRARRIED
ncbi:efflux RND transporter permease subunit [Helcobacillus sp. ACRRO]|uniref:efflux RND transporter permease subunit n=1 Tax=Helcobacillus sp. ACRRO TaxID=2918202 RepID=UPI001EF6320F|nr:efflux RND transporter permease subunit [Helcobacillus sp. ACRRO]